MVLTVQNQTANTLTYLGGALTIAGNASHTATAAEIFPLARDAQLTSDTKSVFVFINDGVSTYQGIDALDYLNQVALSLGGAVVGFAGANAPSFQITVGGKDSAGKSQPARMNQFADLSTNFRNTYSNITGNATTTVKSGAGTLHGIIINNNSSGGDCKIYDNTAGSGTVIANIQIGSPSGGLLSNNGIPPATFLGPLGCEFTTGLTVVTSGSSSNNVTIIYQ